MIQVKIQGPNYISLKGDSLKAEPLVNSVIYLHRDGWTVRLIPADNSAAQERHCLSFEEVLPAMSSMCAEEIDSVEIIRYLQHIASTNKEFASTLAKPKGAISVVCSRSKNGTINLSLQNLDQGAALSLCNAIVRHELAGSEIIGEFRRSLREAIKDSMNMTGVLLHKQMDENLYELLKNYGS